MKKFTFSVLLLALTATGTIHAQTIYLQNFSNNSNPPDGQNLSTSNGDVKGAIAPNGGPDGSPADTISFDNSQYAIYGGNVGGYDSDGRNRVSTATSTNLSDYVISFDVKATNLATNSDFTFTPQVSIIRNYGGDGSDANTTLTGSQTTLTSGTPSTNGFVHFSFDASTFAASNGNFGANISASDYDQTVFELLVGNTEQPYPGGDLGSSAFNAGTSTISIDNLEIDQVTAVPEPALGLALVSGLMSLCAVRPLRRVFSGPRAA